MSFHFYCGSKDFIQHRGAIIMQAYYTNATLCTVLSFFFWENDFQILSVSTTI